MDQPLPIAAEPIIPPPAPSTRKFSPILILAAVILLVAVGTGGIFLGKSLNNSQPLVQSSITPTPLPAEFSVSGFAETTNWKTYLNQQFDLSFKYPSNLTLVDNSRDARSGTIWVSFADFPFGIQIEELLKTDSKNYLNMPKISERTISGITWEILYFDPKSPEGGGPQTVYQTINKDYRYIVNYNWPQYSTQIDQILSTFKFLNQDQADETANWKTYTNTKYGFQIKYPFQWFSDTYEKGDESVLFLNPSRQPAIEGTEPYEPITILVDTKNKSQTEFIANWQEANFKATSQVGISLPFNAVEYSVEKVQPAPGPDSMTIFVMPLKTNFLLIQVNDSSLVDTANQILSTFQFTSP